MKAAVDTLRIPEGRIAQQVRELRENYQCLLRRWPLIRYMVSIQTKTSLFGTLLQRGWQVLLPLAHMLIYYFLIVIIFRHRPVGVHPFLTLMLGLSHYLFISQALNAACVSIISREGLLKHVKIEPLVYTAVFFCRSVRDFGIFLSLYAVFYVWLGTHPSGSVLAFPLLLLLLLTIVWSLSILLSSLTVYLRDLNRLGQIILRLMMYVSPVLYTLDFVPQRYLGIYLCNPIACLFALLHWSLLDQRLPPTWSIALLLFFTLGLFLGAHVVYNKVKGGLTKAL